jgi:hypothetical protein
VVGVDWPEELGQVVVWYHDVAMAADLELDEDEMNLARKTGVDLAGSSFARNDKEPGPSWGKQLPGERPRETAET